MSRDRDTAHALAREHKAEVFDSTAARLRFDVTVWLPAGLNWTDNGCHSLVVIDDNRLSGWRTLLERMKLGVQRCNGELCDTCTEGEVDRLHAVLAAVEKALDGGPGGYTDRTVKVWNLHQAMNAAGRTQSDATTRWGTRPA